MSADEEFKALIAHAPALRRYATARIPHLLTPVLNADDILQDVWIRVLKAQIHTDVLVIPHLEEYLKSIASSVIVDRLREQLAIKRGGYADPAKRRRAHQMRSSYAGLINHVTGPHKSPSAEVAILETVEAIHDALKKLPELQREAVSLRHILGLSSDEVAQRMNRTRNAVYGLLDRGMQSLRTELRFAGRFLSDAASEVE